MLPIPPDGTLLTFEERLSDCPLVDRVWRSHSHGAGDFLSIAATRFEIVVSRVQNRTFLTLRGPETRATSVHCPAGGEWRAIRFTVGTFMPQLPPSLLIDRRDVTLPDATRRSFWLNGSAWEYPDFDNAETFVTRLVHKGLIVRDAAVEATLRPDERTQSLRSTQRHFLRATGLTHCTVRRIERARHATNLLKQGRSILDVVHEAGYFDQAHLTRSLKLLVGQTPAQVIRAERQLSFLYKTRPLS